jgi:DNA-binding NarL/FixJ family response regulator
MTRILLVDDHVLFREGLARLLEANASLQIAGQCSQAAEALAFLSSGTIDLVLLDYDLGDHRGSEILAAARKQGFKGKILLVTVGVTPAELDQVVRLGVNGVVLKHNSPEKLLEIIQRVLAGEEWIDPRYSTGRGDPAAAAALRARFTDRDRQVLRCVFQGKANKEIAEFLNVSESAVKASLQQLFAKTGVRTRSQLVRVALEHYRKELL